MKQQTLVLIKPDGVTRGLIGKIIQRIEDIGLKIIAMKMVLPNEQLAKAHYKLDEEWAKKAYEKTKAVYDKENKPFPYKTPMEIAETIQERSIKFLKENPVIAMVVEGPGAIEIIRELTGNTEPRQALPGTIRGDLAKTESYRIASEKQRVLRNLIHASDSKETAEYEIPLWFKPEEIYDYTKELDRHF